MAATIVVVSLGGLGVAAASATGDGATSASLAAQATPDGDVYVYSSVKELAKAGAAIGGPTFAGALGQNVTTIALGLRAVPGVGDAAAGLANQFSDLSLQGAEAGVAAVNSVFDTLDAFVQPLAPGINSLGKLGCDLSSTVAAAGPAVGQSARSAGLTTNIVAWGAGYLAQLHGAMAKSVCEG